MGKKTLKVNETTHRRLETYKAQFEHTSFDSAIRELISENKRLEAELSREKSDATN